ncbi:MAG TPA: hypothetical protein VFU13_15935 [Steroidobacteraceae bacterium]|nr:hypothetical protein [Steroidobacteraceae bacterium]
MEFGRLYSAYLNRLQVIARSHDELTDTDVRERLHEVINYFFIWDKPQGRFPKKFAMMSAGADRAVAAATRAFINEALKFARKSGIEAGAARHALIEDDSVKSRNGDAYDVYLGSSPRVQAAKRPAPDSTYARAQGTRKKRLKPLTHDPEKLAVTVGGITVIPRHDPAWSGFYQYEMPDGSFTGIFDRKQAAKSVRREGAKALAKILEERRMNRKKKKR